MMDISFISHHNSSRVYFERSQSIVNESFEVQPQFNDNSRLLEFNISSNINSIYKLFKEVTKSSCETSDYLKLIYDFNSSLLQYFEIIKKNVNMLNKQFNDEYSNVSSIIYNEIKTWKLLFLLCEDRFRNVSNMDSEDFMQSNSIYSELGVLRELYRTNKELRESQIVVDWLEYFMKEKLDSNTDNLLGSHGKAWEHTKYLINKQCLYTMNRDRSTRDLDPDAPLKGKLVLTDSDKNNENEYLKYLYYCIQSGDIDKCKSICQSHDELWRAQSFEGWKPFTSILKEDPDGIFNNDIIGNPNRRVFKMACQKLSENTSLNIYERAIYAVFCGNLEVLSLIEKDWNGLLWSYFKAFLESKKDHYLRTYTNTGLFNTQSIFGEDDLDLSQFNGLDNYFCKSSEADNTNLNIEQIFNEISMKLLNEPKGSIKRGFNSDQKLSKTFYQSIFEEVQRFVILEDISGLIEWIRKTIDSLSIVKTMSEKNILRFLTHLIIFMYSTHDGLEMNIYYYVLEEYIKCLLQDKWLNVVTFYISKLSTDLQIKWYCECLKGVTNNQERKKCLEDALEYDIPIVEITRLVVESTRNMDMTFVESSITPDPVNIQENGDKRLFVSELDKMKINSLDWLCFLQDQQCYLIRHANALVRIFLEQDKLEASKLVMKKISDDIWSQVNINVNNGPLWLTDALYENECLRAYIHCHDLFGNWYNHFSCQKPADLNMNMDPDLNKLSFQEKQLINKKNDDYMLALEQWKKLVHFHANKAFEYFMGLLKMGHNGWLSEMGNKKSWQNGEINNTDNDLFDNRVDQIKRLRRKCIVNIVFMALNILMNSEEDQDCFLLTDLLADENYKLYLVFDKTQLKKVIHKIRQCSLQLMSNGKDALGIPF